MGNGGDVVMSVVIYFSKSGHTAELAQKISQQLSAEIAELKPVKPYPESYSATTTIAEAEKKQNLRPAFQPLPIDLAEHQEIFLGYPIWWGTFPMVVTTFLEKMVSANQIIYPFATHEGSGLGASIENLQQLLAASQIKTGLAIRGSNVSRSDRAIANWLHQYHSDCFKK
ncbi:flavodoxin [Enterococcus sp. HY326]|uniref:flavodoxin n=1 Tax=Enterococcus sp. HY326 TaxID=2971265 RepID=UPI00223F434E|nr:flavodoxin [Enterococcus sp. HY326]